MDPQDPKFERDTSLHGLSYDTSVDDLRHRTVLHNMEMVVSSVRPAEMPAHQPGVPIFSVTLTYGDMEAAPLDRVTTTMDMTLEQVVSIAAAINDCFGQILGTMVETSMDHWIAEHPAE